MSVIKQPYSRLSYPDCYDNHAKLVRAKWQKHIDFDKDWWDYSLASRSQSCELYPFDKDDKPIVLFLGDSYTYGEGVYAWETFSHRLSQTLFQNSHVVNLAYPGSSQDFSVTKLSQWYNQFGSRIQTVIFQFTYAHRRLRIDDSFETDPVSPYYNHRRLKWRPQFWNIAIPEKLKPDWWMPYLQLNNKLDDFAYFEHQLFLTQLLTEKYHTNLVWWTNRNSFHDQDNEEFFGTWRQRLPNLIDLNYLLYNSPIDLHLWDGHWSAKGHYEAAKEIEKQLCK